MAGIYDLAVNLASKGRLGQAGANGGGDLSHGDWAGKFALGTVGECNLNHGVY